MSGYLKIMNNQKVDIKEIMSTHLAELMANAELYGWEATHAFHAVVLQQLEQGRALWQDMELKLSYRCALV